MNISSTIGSSPALLLDGVVAADLMSASIVSIKHSSSLGEAVSLLIERDLHALPVLNEHGDPVGVLSRSDVVAYDVERYHSLQQAEMLVDGPLMVRRPSVPAPEALVEDIMTRVVYSVTSKTPAKSVIDGMLVLGVHRLFVTDAAGKLLGVISSNDILRHLKEPVAVECEDVEMLVAKGAVFEQAVSATAAEP